ncbi:MAG: hypothetical protein ACC700_14265 [Anaerolineales bacterium]
MSQSVGTLRRERLRPASPAARLGLGLGLLGLAAVRVVVYATRIGPWAYSDGAGYMMLARNVLAGRGLGLLRASGEFQPLSMHPPLYPLSLVAIGLTGVELLPAARWLDAALFVIAIAMVGTIIYYVSRMVWLGVAAAAVTLVTPSLVTIYTGTLSEPLYFAASLGSLLLLLLYFNSGRRWILVVAAVLAGLAVVTRYLGAAFVGAGILGLLLFGDSDRRRRLLDTALFTGLAAIPTALWFAWVNAQGGSDAPRQWIWELAGLWERTEPIRGGLVAEFWDWIPFANAAEAVPYRYQLGILTVIGVTLAALLLIIAGKLRSDPSVQLRRLSAWQLICLMGVFTLTYIVVLSGVFLFGRPPLDAADIDQRILTPVYLALLLSAFALVPLLRQAWPQKRWVMAAPLALTVLALAWFIPQSWREIQRLHDTSAGFTAQSWMNSETVESARSLPEEISIITNESTAMMFHLDRPSYDVPELLRAEQQVKFLRFGDGESGEERIFRENGAALVLFDSVYWQLRGVYDEQADTRLASMVDGLDLYADLSDGAIYFYPRP